MTLSGVSGNGVKELCGKAWEVVLANRQAEKAALDAAESGDEGWTPS